MFSDIQPKAWINSISTLANSSSRVYMNVEGFVRLGEGQTSGWRKLKIEEIVKISLKILKKHPHCFEETDIVLWREAFTNFKNKNNNKGKIEIQYYTQAELERIYDMLKKINE